MKHSENKIVTYFVNEVGPGVLPSLTFNKYTICKNFTQDGQNRHIISFTWFVPLVFLQYSCLLGVGLENSRPNPVFKQPIIFFRMLYSLDTLSESIRSVELPNKGGQKKF